MIRACQFLIGLVSIGVAGAQADPEISEFLAVNRSVLADGDGNFSDWIEIHNPAPSAVDLSGWHLTDSEQDLIRWTFPAGSVLGAGAYEIVFATGDPSPPPSEWHASFSLDGGGEYLALVRPDGLTVVSDFSPTYPAQRSDISYGRTAGGSLNFFTSPTPGAANGSGVLGFVGDTQFSHHRGFYDDPFDLTITATEPASTIRYTLDGSEPTPAHGSTYLEPIPVSTTSVLRVRAFKDGFLPTNIDTQTYLFPDDVIEQPANIDGWPNNSYSLGRGTGTHDYEMDPAVVTSPDYADMIGGALVAIPTVSIVTDRGGMFGVSGFYDASDVEKPASIEVIYPDEPGSSEQVDGGVEGHSHIRMKRSLRLNFRKELGATSFETDLFEKMPWNPPGVGSQDVLILRAGNNRAWSRSWSEERNTYCEDQLSRQTQLAASGYGMRGAFVHLYINGLYWGLYDVVERADEHFTSSYFGGEADDWYARNHGGSLSGSSSRYNYLTDDLKNKNMGNAANYAELGEYLDLEGFVDYLLVHWLSATGDWPNNNWYAGHRMTASPLGATPLRYFAWDSEWSWDLPHSSAPNPAPYDPWVHKDFTAGRTKNQGPTMARVFNSAKDSPAFLRLLADRAYH
ncbi:MAG: lamin tail domain-containing protein, partial [Verrucomicrobiales bacterium]